MRTLKREAEATVHLSSKERLSTCVRILARIDENRKRSQSPGLGSSIERQIVERELLELEFDILADPGALAPHVANVRIDADGTLPQ